MAVEPPVQLELTGTDVWQTHMGNDHWQDVDETWTERLNEACRNGISTITLQHVWRNRHGEEVHSKCEIDFTGARDGGVIMQENCGSGTVRPMRVIELMAPNVVKSPQQVPPAISPPPAGGAASSAGEVPIGG